MKKVLYILICIGLFFSSCYNQAKDENKSITIFCAASLTDVISEIVSDFEEKEQIEVKLNLASSGTLARQIEHGATPGIFISANKNWVDYLNQLNLTIPETEKSIASNSMVLIAPLESKLDSFAFFLGINLPEIFEGRISIGDPQYVPAGAYTLQILNSLRCRDSLESRFLPAKDVRSALMVVELGEAEAGIVYKTDALRSTKIKIITEFPDSLHKPINYYMVMIKNQKNETSTNLYNYIVSQEMAIVWEKYGFKF
jgi:molybdate transport system substrate-binding protein